MLLLFFECFCCHLTEPSSAWWSLCRPPIMSVVWTQVDYVALHIHKALMWWASIVKICKTQALSHSKAIYHSVHNAGWLVRSSLSDGLANDSGPTAKGEGLALDTWYSTAYTRRLVNSSASQSWKWQLTLAGLHSLVGWRWLMCVCSLWIGWHHVCSVLRWLCHCRLCAIRLISCWTWRTEEWRNRRNWLLFCLLTLCHRDRRSSKNWWDCRLEYPTFKNVFVFNFWRLMHLSP